MKVETAYDYSWRPLPTMQCSVSAHVLLLLTSTRVASICHAYSMTLVTTRAISSFFVLTHRTASRVIKQI